MALIDHKLDLIISILAPFTSIAVISEITGLKRDVISRHINRKLDLGLVTHCRMFLSAVQARELLKHGKVKTVVERYFSKAKTSRWTKPEIDFLTDAVGIMSDYEIAHWLGREPYAVEFKRRSLGLKISEESGFLSTKDISRCTGLSKYILSRDKSKGILVPNDASPAYKDVTFKVGKLRYHMKSLTKKGINTKVDKLSRLLKGKRFNEDQYTYEAIDNYIQAKGLQNTKLNCIMCGKPSVGSCLCSTCD